MSAGGGTAAEPAPDCTMLMDCAHGGCACQHNFGLLTLIAAIAAYVMDWDKITAAVEALLAHHTVLGSGASI